MKLKYTSKIIGSLAMLLAVSSCTDFLDQTNPNSLTTGVFWEDLEDCNTGLTSVYNAFKNENIYTWRFDFCISDIAWPNGHSYNAFPKLNDEWHMHTYTSDSYVLNNKWSALYTGIFRANQVLEGLEGIKADMIDEEDLEQWDLIYGQATFFRALFHFYLYCSFNEGNVPLVKSVPKSEADFYYACSKREDVQAFVRSEMEIAESLLPVKGSIDDWGSADVGRPTSGSASAILGLTYLYENEPAYHDPSKKPNYAKAAEYFKKIIDNTNYSLAGPFDNSTTMSENNNESILEINYTLQHNSSYDKWDSSNLSSGLSILASAPSTSVNGGERYIPSYWIHRAYGKEPVDQKRSDSKVYLKTDCHNDIYYFNNDKEYVRTGEDGSSKYLEYYVVKKYTSDLVGKIDGVEVDGTGEFAEPFEIGRYYVLYKKLRVKDFSSREPLDNIASYADFLSPAAAEADYHPYAVKQLAGNWEMVARPYKSMPNEGTWEVYNEGTESNPIYYRYRTNSLRAAASIALVTDEDTPYYDGLRVVDCAFMNEAQSFYRKHTNWDTRTTEMDATDGRSEINIRLIRLASVYLWYAECLLEGGATADQSKVHEAMMYVNRLRQRAGTILIGNRADDVNGLFGDCSFQGNNEQDQNFEPEANAGYKSYPYVDLYGTGVTQVTNTAKSVMKHIQDFESPLELATEGYMQRFIDLRRWNITKARFTELSKMKIFKITNYVYNDINAKGAQPELQVYANLTDFDEATNMDWCTGTPLSQYDVAASNYNDQRAYYPIPSKEEASNPNIHTILE